MTVEGTLFWGEGEYKKPVGRFVDYGNGDITLTIEDNTNTGQLYRHLRRGEGVSRIGMERDQPTPETPKLYGQCPALSPSYAECIGIATYHEVHTDGLGTTWRDWAGKNPGVGV